MENRPIFEWSPGNIILENQEDEDFFDNLINDLHHHSNDEENRDYVSEDSDGDVNSLGSWKSEAAAMDKEEGMIVTYDDIDKEGDISDYEYGSNETKEGTMGGDSEVEEGYDDCDNEEGADVE